MLLARGNRFRLDIVGEIRALAHDKTAAPEKLARALGMNVVLDGRTPWRCSNRLQLLSRSTCRSFKQREAKETKANEAMTVMRFWIGPC